jgi:hypothetical protein
MFVTSSLRSSSDGSCFGSNSPRRGEETARAHIMRTPNNRSVAQRLGRRTIPTFVSFFFPSIRRTSVQEQSIGGPNNAGCASLRRFLVPPITLLLNLITNLLFVIATRISYLFFPVTPCSTTLNNFALRSLLSLRSLTEESGEYTTTSLSSSQSLQHTGVLIRHPNRPTHSIIPLSSTSIFLHLSKWGASPLVSPPFSPSPLSTSVVPSRTIST